MADPTMSREADETIVGREADDTAVQHRSPQVESRCSRQAADLDDLDKTLLNLLQGSFTLDKRPYARIAELAKTSEEEVLERTQRLMDCGFIRQISAIFDTRSLGYNSTLVASKIDRESLLEGAEIINEHPGVSHNYERDHEFNLWFTIAVSPDSRLGLERTLEIISERAGLQAYRMLPTLRLFKINVNLEMKDGAEELKAAQDAVQSRPSESRRLSAVDIEVVRVVQGSLPIVSRTYDQAADELGWPVKRLLDHCQELVDRRVLRRVAAILYHRKAGYTANGMGAWKVPENRIEEVGQQMAAVRGISHCYQRPTYPDWPYSIFSMAHGRSRAECDGILQEISRQTGIDEYTILYSRREFKKTRLSYFVPAFEEWEALHLQEN